MNRFRCLIMGIVLVVVAGLMPGLSQSTGDEDRVWSAFVAWVRAAPEDGTLKAYSQKLGKDGLSQAEIQRQLEIIRRLFPERPEGIEIIYDRIFSRPLTGDPAKDGFTSTPSQFMVEATKGLKPGKVLDVGTGQGRNAVWLAQQGWDVTGIDISGAGLAAASANAKNAGVGLTTVKTTYDAYDFGTNQWDLIVMILSWAPVSDPAFVAKLNASLRPGGLVVFEHVIDKPEEPFPKVVHALQPDALRTYFGDFLIEQYEEAVRLGDWGGPPTMLVRMIARKKPPAGMDHRSPGTK